ncbi:hypothetical protein MBLNU457_7534t1 [Dothideomycetes sp. NU457]
MAFQQPQQRHQVVRPQPVEQIDTAPRSPQLRKRTLEESQEWVLFSPQSNADTSQTPQTTNLSRVSDFGSFGTGLRSGQTQDNEHDRVTQSDNDDDEEELDSLDDGLHAFQAMPSPRLDQSGGTILPRHDGLGTFPSRYEYADNDELQEQLWQYERYNPHRRRTSRRRSSVQRQLDEIDGQQEVAGMNILDERRLRIEQWRMDQSKAVLEEIEKEAKRRQRRMGRMSAAPSSQNRRGSQLDATQDVSNTEANPPSESFWQRITKKVIHDLIGLDDTTLSVIFGEDLVQTEDIAATPTQGSPIHSMVQESTLAINSAHTWERRLLNHIQRELGVLVYQLVDIEGAFETFNSRTTTPPDFDAFRAQREAAQQARQRREQQTDADHSASDFLSKPTLVPTVTNTETSLWGIEEEPNSQPNTSTPDPDYWTRDPSILMLFNYLRDRFSSSNTQSQPQPAAVGTLPASWSTASALGTSPASLRRADIIRAHHPLVHRAAERSRQRRTSLLAQTLARRALSTSSCASQSTKRSRRSSMLSGGSSRRYWDFGSEGAEGMGWGEV